MAEEVVSRVELVIDGNGLVKMQQTMQSLDRYMERMQWRAQMLSRLQFSTVQRALDRIANVTHAIYRRLQMLTQPIVITVKPNVDLPLFASQGAAAGKQFADAFEQALNIDSLAEKMKTSLNDVVVNVQFKTGYKEDSKGGEELKNFLIGIASSLAATGMIRAVKNRGKLIGGLRNLFNKKPKGPPPTGGGGGPNKPSGGAAAVQSKPVTDLEAYKNKKAAIGRWVPKPPPETPGQVVKFPSPKLPDAKQTSGFRSLNLNVASVAKTAFKTAGKIFKPLSYVTDAATIATAGPGKARNKAIGSMVGGAIGAAVGSLVPGAGTVVGGMIGGYLGELAVEIPWKKIGKGLTFGLLGKKKTGKAASEPPGQLPVPLRQLADPGLTYAASSARNPSGSQPASPTIHVHLPVGAVQLKVEDRLDYDRIAAVVGSKISDSIQRTMENRAMSF